MKLKLSIVKIGGNIIEDQESLSQFLKLFEQLEGKKFWFMVAANEQRILAKNLA